VILRSPVVSHFGAPGWHEATIYRAASGAWVFRALCEALADDDSAVGSAVIAVCLAIGYGVVVVMLTTGAGSLGTAVAVFAGIMLAGAMVSLTRATAEAQPRQA